MIAGREAEEFVQHTADFRIIRTVDDGGQPSDQNNDASALLSCVNIANRSSNTPMGTSGSGMVGNRYTAPEVSECQYSKAMDIFSLGVIYYEMLSGVEKDEDDMRLPKDFTVFYSEESELIEKTLSQNPQQRPAAKECFDLLSDLWKKLGQADQLEQQADAIRFQLSEEIKILSDITADEDLLARAATRITTKNILKQIPEPFVELANSFFNVFSLTNQFPQLLSVVLQPMQAHADNCGTNQRDTDDNEDPSSDLSIPDIAQIIPSKISVPNVRFEIVLVEL